MGILKDREEKTDPAFITMGDDIEPTQLPRQEQMRMDSENDLDPKEDAGDDDHSTASCCAVTVRTCMRAWWILVVLTQIV